VPINKYVRDVLASLPRAMHHDYVFTYKGEQIRYSISEGFQGVCERAGIVYGRDVENGVVFHDLRASAKTNMLEAGIDKAFRDKLVGHSLPGMDAYYLRIKDKHLREAMDRYTSWLEAQIEVVLANAPQNAPQIDVTS